MRTCFSRWLHDRRGATAVEFAFVAPILVLLLFGIVGFAAVMSVDNGLQQLVAEAARASVAGLTDAERTQLAQKSVSDSVCAYPFIDVSKLTMSPCSSSSAPSTSCTPSLTCTSSTSSASNPSSTSFQVTLKYDMSGLFAYKALSFLPLPSPAVTRSAVVQRGGF